MARVGLDETDPNQPATKNISSQRARQGQNVKGMIWVLVISIGLVVAAYAVMLALQAKPVTADNRIVEDVAPTPGPGGPAPAIPETAQSPT
ncbi:MAG: hypothetical protein IPO30_09475 [Hyphomonadaceae bacterium]|jgi:hypothetical protein|nr:hypothetical protein [Hyphomonadaceae bacterium]MBP9234410.1 hypothetical protein [Hyphomonadaceae bacterium]